MPCTCHLFSRHKLHGLLTTKPNVLTPAFRKTLPVHYYEPKPYFVLGVTPLAGGIITVFQITSTNIYTAKI